jgi:polysaccharide biosynthesis/export protein
VKISGEVQKPGEYRLYQNLTIHDLLLMAGNPKFTAYLENAELTRLSKTDGKVTSSVVNINLQEALNNNPEHNLLLKPFDELTVRRIPNWSQETERYVILKGEFRFPGNYPIFKGEKISSIIERAGGYSDKAYLPAAKLMRVSVRELQQKRMDEIILKTEQEILKKQTELASVASSKEELEASKATLEGLQRTVQILKTAKAEGRLVIHLDVLDKFRGSANDVELQGGDTLELPQIPNAVNVLGQVYNPTSIIPAKDETVAFYLAKAGGPTREAQEDEIYVVRADGTVVSRQQSSFFQNLFASGFMASVMEPGDTIVVPQRFEKTAWMRDLKDIATIFGQLAITAGVLIAAGL